MPDIPRMPSFVTGAEAAKEQAESTRGGNFPKVHYLGLKEDEQIRVRFLTEQRHLTSTNPNDSWISVLEHAMVPTRDAPTGYSGTWPKQMSAVCRTQAAFDGWYNDCFICEFVKNNFNTAKPAKPGSRTWTVCVVRVPITDASGKIVGYDDATREEAVMVDGVPSSTMVTVPDVRLVNFGWDNFFKVLAGFDRAYGTLMDRDYSIRRTTKMVGTNKVADYQIIPVDKTWLLPPSPEHPTGIYWDLSVDGLTAMNAALPSGSAPLSLGTMYPNVPDITNIIVERTTDDYYNRFFDVRNPQPVRKSNAEGDAGATDSGATAAAAQAAPPPNADAMAALAARIKGYPTAAPAPS
jgi:hypothetical protein